MPYKKRTYKDTSDKRPVNMRQGNLNYIIGTNIDFLQQKLGWTNDQMAAALQILSRTENVLERSCICTTNTGKC